MDDEMKMYIGTKLISAKPLNRIDYNLFRGWKLLADEDGTDEGYLVEYQDGGKPNTPYYKGYVSWSPKDQFDLAYRLTTGLSFGQATTAMQLGKKVSRHGWNGAGMFVFLVPGSVFKVNRAPLLGIYPEGTEIKYRSHMDIKHVDGSIGPWTPSPSDSLETDWYIVD